MKNRVVACLLVLVGCSLGSIAAETAPVVSEEKIAKGLLMQHAGRVIFSPCRHQSYYQVEDLSPNAGLTAQLGNLGLAEGKNLYVEFQGTLEGDTLKARQINLARAEARCHEAGGPDERWRAAGQDEAWRFVAIAGEILLTRPGKPDLKLPYNSTKTENDLIVLTTAEKPDAQWRFERRYCRDQSAGMLFGWQAEIKIEGEVLHGCAWQR
jgi:uncharacterized membrane protein